MTRLTTTACAAALLASPALAEFELTILHTNDFHDRFEPISGFDGPCSEEDAAAGECFGGIARMITAVEAARERAGENVILLDAGDQFQGSLYYTQYGGDLAAEFMPQLGYDAMAVGNHEFDDGSEGLAEFVAQVEFPVLSANIDVTGVEGLEGEIGKSTVLEVGGERIGIVSALAEDTPETSSPGESVVFSPAADAVQAQIDALTEDGVNKIVLLTHVGLPADMRLAEEVTGADLIIGGHSHTLLANEAEGAEGPYPTEANGVPIVQAYAYGKYLGELTVTFDDAGEVISVEGEPILLDASVAQDEAAVARMEELAQPLEELRSEVVAQASGFIDGDRAVCRAQECPMGNLIADAMLERVADQGIDVAIQNGGGIRASIDEGEVTMGEVLTVLPFQNTLSTFRVPGQAILDALENGVSQVEEGAGRFPQVAGMAFTWDASAEPGSRIVEATVGGEPLDPAATYGVVSNNYVRGGGDGYAMFESEATDVYDFGPDLADVVAEHMAGETVAPPEPDGRITRRN
jgi:5'-nucleotidase